MTTVATPDLTRSRPQPDHASGPELRGRARRRERRRLTRRDRMGAHLAELHRIQNMLAGARAVVTSGWLQNGWYAYRTEPGSQPMASAQSLRRMAGTPVSGACLVGAIVQAGGGLAAARTQTVQRALDLTWHTLHGPDHQPVHWCPAPPVRNAHIRDLTRWNDQPGRSPDDVAALLHDAELAAMTEINRVRAC